MVVDGNPRPPFDIVSIPIFSPDGRTLVYAAKRSSEESDQWLAVVNDVAGPVFDSITLPFFSPDGRRTAYMARTDKQWRVVSDGVEGPVFDGVSMPAFSPDGKHLAYLIKQGQAWSVAVDGVPGKTRFLGGIKGARLVFDTAARLHTLVMGVDNKAFARLDVTIIEK